MYEIIMPQLGSRFSKAPSEMRVTRFNTFLKLKKKSPIKLISTNSSSLSLL